MDSIGAAPGGHPPSGPAALGRAELYAASLERQLGAVRGLISLYEDQADTALALAAVADQALVVGEAHVRAAEELMALLGQVEPVDAPPRPAGPALPPGAGAYPERHLVRPVPLPPVDPVDMPYAADPVALVVDHGCATAPALVGRLREDGWTVRQVTLGDREAGPRGDGEAEQRLAGVIAGLPRLDLCLSVLSGDDWDGAVRQLSSSILLAKHALAPLGRAARSGTRAAFVTLTRLDGRLGLLGSASQGAALLGGVAGLVKSLAREAPSLYCRAVDVAPAVGVEDLAAALSDELRDAAVDTLEVGVDADRGRWSVTPGPYGGSPAVAAARPAGADGAPALGADDLVVVTGGARGITAQCVRALAAAVPCTLILLGRTEPAAEPGWAADVADDALKAAVIAHWADDASDRPTPRRVEARYRTLLAQREIRATVDAVAALGATAEYIAVDVADADAVRRALAARAPQVTAVVHGAGALADCLVENKTPEAVRTVFGPKLDGLRNVLDALTEAPLRHLMVFTSVAGLMGNAGQSDYATANEALCRFVATWKRQHPGRQAVAVDWGAWDGGMVTREVRALLAERGVRLLPPDEGARVFTGQFAAHRAGEPRVLVGQAEALGEREGAARPAAFTARRGLSGLGGDPLIAAHRVGAHPVLPATFGLGWMVNVVERALPGLRVVRASDVEVRKGLVLDGSGGEDFFTDVEPAGQDGGLHLVRVTVRGPRTRFTVSHYAATLALGPVTAPAAVVRGDVPWRTGRSTEDALGVYREATLFHGPPLQGLRRELEASGSRLAVECRLPDTRVRAGAFAGRHYSPVLSDLLMQAAAVLARRVTGQACLPLSVGEAALFAPLPDDEAFVVTAEHVRHTEVDATVTVTAYDAGGRVLQRFTDVYLAGNPAMAARFAEGADAWRTGEAR